MRTTASPVDNMLAETLKMIPAPMGFAEIYTALQQGTIDGELLSLADYYTSRRGDVLHYTLPTSHSFTCMVGVISKSYWDSLPSDGSGRPEESRLRSLRLRSGTGGQDGRRRPEIQRTEQDDHPSLPGRKPAPPSLRR